MFANTKITTLVAVSAGIVTLLMVGLMGMAVSRMESLTEDVDAMAQARMPKLAQSTRASETLLRSSRSMRNTLILDTEEEIRAELAQLGKNRQALAEIQSMLEREASGDAERAALKAVADARATYEPFEKHFIDGMGAGERAAAKLLMLTGLRQAQDRYAEALSTFARLQTTTVQEQARAAHRDQERANSLMIVLTIVAAAVAGVATFLIVTGMKRTFGRDAYAVQVARSIAAGDLTQQVRASSGDDAQILAAMRKMRDDLVAAVGVIRASAVQVGTAARQIAAGNTELSSRTEEQASSLEETAASMEELASTVKQNADHAQQADDLAQTASRRAEQGGKEVADVVATMGDISRSAARIADIIGVIDAIAFQTNILALNAAVEAARAGEQGRGFAVVASEVRSLAHRSSDAAREIKQLIGGSVERVDAGLALVERAGGTIQALVEDVKKVGVLMGAIADASAEQSRGVQQVNKTVTEMDKVVQQNAAAVQQSAAAAEAMRTQAEALMAAVSAFRLEMRDEKEFAVMPHPVAHGASRALPGARNTPAVAADRASPVAAEGDDDWRQF